MTHRVDEVLVQVVDVLEHAVVERSRRRRCSRRSTGAARTRTGRRRRRAGRPARRTSPPSAATASTSLTPPSRQLSIWQKPIASACMSCLKITRFWHVLAGRDADRRDRRGDRGVAQHVVGAGRLLDPPAARTAASALHPLDRLVDVPDLVGVHHQLPVRADLLADDRARGGRRPRGRAPTLILKCVQPVGDRLAAEPADLLVGVAEPARRGRVGRDSRRARISARALASRRARCSRRIASASSGVSASVM